MATCDEQKWRSYWQSGSWKRRIIEAMRLLYFAPAFAATVRRHHPAGRVLEAGCGSGQILSHLKGPAFGCDYTVEAARIARHKCRATVVCDISQLPFRDDAFDLIYNQGVMEHFSEQEFDGIMAEFKRVGHSALILVPSATSVFQILNPFDDLDGHFFTRKEIADAVGRTFARVQSRYLPWTLGLSVSGLGRRT